DVVPPGFSKREAISARSGAGDLRQRSRTPADGPTRRSLHRQLPTIRAPDTDEQHLAQSQAFIRWLAGAPGRPRAVDNSIPADTAKIVQEASISALHAIVDGDRPALEALLDADAARSRPG